MPWRSLFFKKLREPVSGLMHFAGFLLSIAGLALLVTYAAIDATSWHVVAFSIFGASLMLLYGTSSLYHLLPVSEHGIAILRRMDHIMIFMLIAGTYTPVCLIPLRGGWGWSMLGAVWGFAFAGVFMKLFWLNAPRWFYTGIYLAMGWMVIIAIYPLVEALPAAAFIWLAIGGLFYTGGAIIYAFKRPNIIPGVFGFHELWHLFVMAGSFSHWWVMMRYILQMKP
jgi:hemolysin III